MAYAASRIQASYGTVKRVLSEVKYAVGTFMSCFKLLVYHQIACRESSFKPETVLDFGSGLGTVPW